MNFTEISLKGFLCLGSAEFPFAPGEQVDVLFAQSGVILQGKTRSARFSYFELAELEITGPGTVTTGGGFVGGGFGVEGALQGMAISAILNGLTTRSKIHTFITLITNFGELHLHYDKMEPSALRVVLASVFQRMRSCDPNWRKQRIPVLAIRHPHGGRALFPSGRFIRGCDLFQRGSFHSNQACDVCDLQGRTQLLG